jgi:hypothetical protein
MHVKSTKKINRFSVNPLKKNKSILGESTRRKINRFSVNPLKKNKSILGESTRRKINRFSVNLLENKCKAIFFVLVLLVQIIYNLKLIF